MPQDTCVAEVFKENHKEYHVSPKSFNLSRAMYFSKLFSKVELTQSAQNTLNCIVHHWNAQNKYAFLKQSTIAEEIGTKRRATVINAIKQLESKEINLIKSEGEKGDTRKYYLTNRFFELIKIESKYTKTVHDMNEKSTLVDTKSVHHEHENKIKQINFNSNNSEIIILSNGFKIKTAFQKEFIDVFERLTSEQIDTYKLLEGYEREKWLIKKRQKLRNQDDENNILKDLFLKEIELPELNDRLKAMEYCFNIHKSNPQNLLAENTKAFKIAQKWGFNSESYRKYKLYGEV